MQLNKIHNVNCYKGIKELKSNSIDLIVTSPPYFVGKEYETHTNFDDYIKDLIKIFKACLRVLKDGCYLCINIDDAHVGKNQNKQYSETINVGTHAYLITELSKHFLYKDMIIWHKIRRFSGLQFIHHGTYPISAFGEFILLFKKKGKRNKSQKEREANKLSINEIKKYTNCIWSFKGKHKHHPAEFPIELPRRLIKMYSFKNDTVMDPFIGSGTTAIAAKQLGRNYIGFEINKEYVDIANERLKQSELKKWL